MNKHLNILAKGKYDYTPLYSHLNHVKTATEKFAKHVGLNKKIASYGAILHDIGKASPVFQKRLDEKYVRAINEEPYRHEIASLFFLNQFKKKIHPQLIEMIVSHHKSISNDYRKRGLYDLIHEYDKEKVFEMHIKDFDKWSHIGLDLLNCFGIKTKSITKEDAWNSFKQVINYCDDNIFNDYDYSKWRGVLMGGDHFASALINNTEKNLKHAFKKPNLSFYKSGGRKNKLYPLSKKRSWSLKKHTIVTACTGAGKTDFLLRRCKGRVFYTLPFTASINAMYERIKDDVKEKNEFIDIRVLHSSSKLGKSKELKLIQSHFGSSIKILTPHQLANIAFGTIGYESTLLDLRGCDIILDEIHTYNDKIQGIVLKIIEMLISIDCRIHIGTATLPTSLYDEILKLLGEKNVYQVNLNEKELNTFNRHIIHKHQEFDDKMINLIKESLNKGDKILIVKNRVADAQTLYLELINEHPNIDVLLLHSRFKRGTRNEREKELMLLNKGDKPCIVISTQVVEVSLDISFDLMITDCAPIMSLIQRFGRINRIRNDKTIGVYKQIYVLSPPEDKKEAMPYVLSTLNKTYEVLPDGDLLQEKEIQNLIDIVYPTVTITSIEAASIFENGEFSSLYKLQHQWKSVLFQELGIMSTNVILESDVEVYEKSNSEKRTYMEIPVIYYSIEKLGLPQLEHLPHKPFIIPDGVYDDQIGLDMGGLRNFNDNSIL